MSIWNKRGDCSWCKEQNSKYHVKYEGTDIFKCKKCIEDKRFIDEIKGD